MAQPAFLFLVALVMFGVLRVRGSNFEALLGLHNMLHDHLSAPGSLAARGVPRADSCPTFLFTDFDD